jgi:hypothetical protein
VNLTRLVVLTLAFPAFSQAIQQSLGRHTCPGDPPGDLSHTNCSFTPSMRVEQFVTSSVTDQAMLGATFFSLMAQFQNNPSEWGRGWRGFGYRVGTRYAQNFAKGLTQYVFGAAIKDDPRHVSYASDPLIPAGKPGGGVSSRIGHAFVDWLTVRRSTLEGNGTRMPNLPMFAGAAASGFVGNAWYPDHLATPQQAGLRASYSLATALASSFYNEFRPEINRLLAVIFRRGRTP